MNRIILAIVIWAAFGLVCLIGTYAHAEVKIRPAKDGIRVSVTTCADVRAVVELIGAAEAERIARAAGATEAQIREARRCLSSSR